MHEVVVNCLVKLAQEKSVVRCTDNPDMTIAVDWDVKQTKRTKNKKTVGKKIKIYVTVKNICGSILFNEVIKEY